MDRICGMDGLSRTRGAAASLVGVGVLVCLLAFTAAAWAAGGESATSTFHSTEGPAAAAPGAGSPLSPVPHSFGAPASSAPRRGRATSIPLFETFETGMGGWWSVDGYDWPTWATTGYRWCSGSQSAYCVGTGVEPPGPYYDGIINEVAIGPFDLSNAGTGTLEFDVWTDCEPKDGDYYRDYGWVGLWDTEPYNAEGGWGTRFWGWGGGWRHISMDLSDMGPLGNVCGLPDVWVVMQFVSDSSITGEGVYVDNIRVETEPQFKPDPDGWQFENGSDTRTADDLAVWTDLFGSSVRSVSAYDAAVGAAKADGEAGIFDGGNCYGCAASCAAYFTGDRWLPDVIPWLLRPYDFGPGYPGWPTGGRLTGSMAYSPLREVELFQLAQFEQTASDVEDQNTISQDNRSQWRGASSYSEALSTWLGDLEWALRSEPQIVTMGSRRPEVEKSQTGGHGVVAYRMETEPNGEVVRVYIYDDNWPGDSTRFIAFWPDPGMWKYTLFDGTTWSSWDGGDRIAFLPAWAPAAAVNSDTPVQHRDGWSVTHLSHAVFSDASGNQSGFYPGGESWEVPGLVAKPQMGLVRGGTGRGTIDFELPDAGAVTLSVRPDASRTYLVQAPGVTADVSVSGAWPVGAALSAPADTIAVDGDGTRVTLQRGAAAEVRAVLSTDWGTPVTTIDLAFEKSTVADGAASAAGAGATLQLNQVASGIAVDVTDAGDLARPLAIGWMGGDSVPVTMADGVDVRVEFTGGAAGGTPGVDSTVTVRIDADGDGQFETTAGSTTLAPPGDQGGTYVVAGPSTFAKRARGVHRRPMSLYCKAVTPNGDGLSTLSAVVKNARGKTLKRIRLGGRKPGRWYAARWVPVAKGKYRYFVYATDSLGVGQSHVGTAVVTVK